MRHILSYYRFYKVKFFIVVVTKFLGTLLDLIIPFLLSYILDNVIKTISKENFMPIIYYGLLMILASLFAFILSYKANQIASFIGCNCANRVRNDLFSKIETLSLRQIDDISLPSLISRVSSDTYNINQFYNMLLRIGLRAPILFFGGLIASFMLNARLTIIMLLTIPFILIIIIITGKIGIPLFSKIQKSLDSLVTTLREDISGIRVIKSLVKENKEKERYDKVNQKVINYELKSAKIMNIVNPSISLIMNISVTLVVLLGAILFNIDSSYATSGQIIAFLSYFNIILNSMVAMSRVFITYSKASASSIRINYVLNLNEDHQKQFNQEVSSYFIEFKNVSFSYNHNRNNLENINFSLEQYESLGIIGGTGSGKTTLLNLLLNLYDDYQGEIFVNYRNIKSYNHQQLLSLFGSVFQNNTLFNMSIKENVDFYRNLNDDDIIKALRVAQCDFVFKLKDKEKTIVDTKGNNFSGGQKQRLLIARALANHPSILVLDDSFSALDYETDATLRQSIKQNYLTTLIIVGQRVSSIMNATKIIVLNNGRIEAIGNNEQLLKSSSLYRDIYSSQTGGDINA